MYFDRDRVMVKVGVLGLVALVCASPASAESLKQSVQAAMNSFPTIQEARHLRKAIESDLGVAKSLYLPTLDLDLAYGREYSDNSTTRAAGHRSVTLDRKESGLMLREVLFDGFDREGAIDEQEAKLRGVEHHISDRGETIASNVASSYIDVVRHKQILGLAQENLKVHKKILDDVKKRVDGGQLGVGDLQQAKSRTSSAEARITEVRLDLDKAKISFNRLVGHMPKNLSQPKFSDSRMPRSVNAAVRTAMETNPLIKKFQAELDVAKARITMSKSGNYPNLSLELGGTYNDNIDGTPGIDKDYSAMLRMKWNLFRGGADKSKAKGAAARHSQSMSQLADAKRRIEQEVRRAWSAVVREDAELKIRSAQVESNQEVTETYREEFKIGQRDLLDVLDSENELFSSKTKLLSAQNSALYARFLLMATTGKLRQMLGVTTPVEITATN
ncbi:MAG: TolC family outer membrane protein [Gammaproteobacteria bacterium]|nr:TolC family outer membrane protein [Gammaproteobacteria bacterium]